MNILPENIDSQTSDDDHEGAFKFGYFESPQPFKKIETSIGQITDSRVLSNKALSNQSSSNTESFNLSVDERAIYKPRSSSHQPRSSNSKKAQTQKSPNIRQQYPIQKVQSELELRSGQRSNSSGFLTPLNKTHKQNSTGYLTFSSSHKSKKRGRSPSEKLKEFNSSDGAMRSQNRPGSVVEGPPLTSPTKNKKADFPLLHENNSIDEPPTTLDQRKKFWTITKKQEDYKNQKKEIDPLSLIPTAKYGKKKSGKGPNFYSTLLVKKAVNKLKKLTVLTLTPKQLDLMNDFKVLKSEVQDGDYKLTKLYTISEHLASANSKWNNFLDTNCGKFLQKRCPNRFKKKRKAIKVKEKQPPLKERIKNGIKSLQEPFYPNQRFRLLWDILLMALLMVDMVFLPLQLAFSAAEDNRVYEFTNDALFILDIFLNFHTAYFYKGDLITSHKKIALNYLHTWLLFDIISSFPYGIIDIVVDAQDDSGSGIRSTQLLKLLRGLKLLKLLRALRFFKLNKIFKKLGSYIESSQSIQYPLKVLKLLITVALLAHWLACGFYLVGSLEQEFSQAENWISKNNLTNESKIDLYLYSIYWAVTTILTVGYGDIHPVSVSETWYGIFALLLGCGVFAYILSQLGRIISEMSASQAQVKNKIEVLDRFLQRKNMTTHNQNALKNYIEYMLETEGNQKQELQHFLSVIPSSLQKEVLIDLNSKVMIQNKVFNLSFKRKFICALSYGLEEQTLGPEDVIFEAESSDERIYFLRRGRVQLYLAKNDKELAVLHAGDHFGEIKFFSGKARRVSARSLNFSNMFFLERKAFLQIVRDFPKDNEAFLNIRDKIIYYDNLIPLKVKCFCCDREGHQAVDCPDMHFISDPYSVMLQERITQKKFRAKFIRKNRQRFSARRQITDIVDQAIEFQKDQLQGQTMNKIQRSMSLSKNKAISTKKLSQDQIFEEIQNTLTKTKIDSTNSNNAVTIISSQAITNTNVDNNSPSSGGADPSKHKRRRSSKKRLVEEPKNYYVPSKPRRKPVFDLDSDIFDKVKIFRRYFVHNNIVNVVKKLKPMAKDYIVYSEKLQSYIALHQDLNDGFDDDIFKNVTKQFPPHVNGNSTKESAASRQQIHDQAIMRKSRTRSGSSRIERGRSSESASQQQHPLTRNQKKSSDFLNLNSERSEKFPSITDSSYGPSLNSINSNNRRNSRQIESKTWKISLISPEENGKVGSVLFEHRDEKTSGSNIDL